MTLTLKPLIACLFVLTLVSSAPAEAKPVRTPGRFGLGIGMGTIANGLSAKYFIDGKNALQFNLGEFGGRGYDHRWRRFGGFGFSADYLFEMPAIARAGNAFELAWNLGAGVGVGFDDDDYDRKDEHYEDYFALAASFVLGLEFNFIPIPLDIVIEYRPGLLLVPYVDLDPIDFTAHIRVYF